VADRTPPAGRLIPTLAPATARALLALAVVAWSVLTIPAAFAVQPDEMLADPALETRAREIGKELRCLVCQNESIDESNADLARDLRLLVRERLQAGATDQQVIDYVVSRYGDFVLLRPPFKPETLALWLGPVAIVLLGIVVLVFYFRRRAAHVVLDEAPGLDPDEERRLAQGLGNGQG
jgi:cytochrome c-type biogenesis protein CcmH